MQVHCTYLIYIIILFSALGDPLIKGLTEVANSRPTDPIAFLANYLHGFSKDKNMVNIIITLYSAPRINKIVFQIFKNTDEPVAEAPTEMGGEVVDEHKTPERVIAQTSFDTSDEQPVPDDSPELAQTSDDRVNFVNFISFFAY